MQAGIELSDDDRDLDPFEDDLAVRGKGGRKTGGRQTGTADATAAAEQLQQVGQLVRPVLYSVSDLLGNGQHMAT